MTVTDWKLGNRRGLQYLLRLMATRLKQRSWQMKEIRMTKKMMQLTDSVLVSV